MTRAARRLGERLRGSGDEIDVWYNPDHVRYVADKNVDLHLLFPGQKNIGCGNRRLAVVECDSRSHLAHGR